MKNFPAETFVPKVRIGHTVEQNEVEKTYKNLKVEAALEAEGVKSYDILPPEKIRPLLSYTEKYDLYSKVNYLPLEVFDNEEYDCR